MLRAKLFRCEVGSRLFGTATKDSDRDEMMVEIDSFDDVVRSYHKTKEVRDAGDGQRASAGDSELVVHPLSKWVSLAIKGNPTVLSPLFAPEERFSVISKDFIDLREHRDWFLSERTIKQFLGYMTGQKSKLLQLKSGTNRPELIAKHGFDTKFAYHMVRLGMNACDWYEYGTMFPMWDRDVITLLEIRNGKWTLEQVTELADRLALKLEGVLEYEKLPKVTAEAEVFDWLKRTYLASWGYQQKVG